jgi:hypothetical protein
MSRRAALVSLAALTAVAAGVLVPPAQAVGPELLPNPSFETGYNTVPIVVPGVRTFDQPLLPVGWAFEGAAGLFDHSAEAHHGPGRYSAAISDPVSTQRRACQQPDPAVPETCVDSPANVAKDAANGAAVSVTPAWRPLNPVSVNGGGSYVVSGWYKWTFASQNIGGALVKVRWLDANGVGLGTSTVVDDAAKSADLNWTSFSATVTAPASAIQAIPLFGARDDQFITQVAYDEVSFHAA